MTERKLEKIEDHINELQEQLNPHNNPSSSLIMTIMNQFVIIEDMLDMMGYSVELNNKRWTIVEK